MTYKSIMVSVDLTPAAPARIKLAAAMAGRFEARLIGAAAETIYVPAVATLAPIVDANLIELEQDRVRTDLEKIEALFRRGAGNGGAVEWRAAIEDPRSFLLRHGRAADLMIMGRHGHGDDTGGRFGIDPGALVLELGRPILVAPGSIEELSAQRIIVGWKDTREARRAVWDSLPLLKRSEQVFLISAGESPPDSGATDVQDYLRQHDVPARILLRSSREEGVAEELVRTAESEGADLIVAGAYGHSRMREWIFGGVTRDLLHHSPICCLLAH
jgi:nucleotide-binding universal stress UspA family protein